MDEVTLHTSNNLEIFTVYPEGTVKIPFVGGISAGFPSPAADFIDLSIDLTKELIKNPSTTFMGRVRGNSMVDAGFNDGDVLIVDKSLEAKNDQIVVCFLDGEFTVKRIEIKKDEVWLVAENPNYKPIRVTPDNEFIIWGVVTYIIKKPK